MDPLLVCVYICVFFTLLVAFIASTARAGFLQGEALNLEYEASRDKDSRTKRSKLLDSEKRWRITQGVTLTLFILMLVVPFIAHNCFGWSAK